RQSRSTAAGDTMNTRRLLRLAVASIFVALLLPACSHQSPSSARPHATATTVHKLNPNFDYGHTVSITGTGFEPKSLVTAPGTAVTWTNTTTATQHLLFDNFTNNQGQHVDSGPIAPGATWVFHADELASIVYHSTVTPTWKGNVQVLPPAEN